MHTKAVFHAAKALARIDCPVLRFNFRGVGRSAGRSRTAPASRMTFAPRSISWSLATPA